MTTKKTTTSKRQRSWLILRLFEAGKKVQMRRTKATVKKKTKMKTRTRKTTMRTTETGTVAPPLQCLNLTISKQAVKTIPIKAPVKSMRIGEQRDGAKLERNEIPTNWLLLSLSDFAPMLSAVPHLLLLVPLP